MSLKTPDPPHKMPPQPTITEIRLNNITECLTITANTLEILASSLNSPFLAAMSNTTQSLLKNIQDPPQNPQFVEAQQKGSILKNFFRQGEMSTLLKDCKAGLQQGLEIFQVPMANHMKDITQMQEDAKNETKNPIDKPVQIVIIYQWALFGSHNSSNSISMLPPEPKIFHGRNSELSNILQLFGQGTPGLPFWVQVEWERPVLQELSSIVQKLPRDIISIATQVELAALIGAHVGLKPGKDLTHPVIQYFSSSSKSLLILDNLETLWEPVESRGKIEEFLSLLTGVDHLALVTICLLQLILSPIWSTLRVLPCIIRWEEEKTSLISDGYDRTSNLDFSISLSLSSPRLNPHSKDLLSLLSMLPDGLSDVELVQSKLPIDNILGCRAALIRTALAYSDEHKQLKVLVPIREYMQKIQPPGGHLTQPLCKHFQELLEFYMEFQGNQSSSSTVARVSSNYTNIQNLLQNGLQQGHTDLVDSIYCACNLNRFSRFMGQGPISLIQHIRNVLPYPHDHRLEAYFNIEWLNSQIYSISNPDTLISDALDHFKEFDDPDLKCRIYNALATYYRIKGDPSSAMKFCAAAISLAISAANTKQHSPGFINLAWVEWTLGDYSAAQVHAKEAQRLAIISADLHREAQALRIEAICCYTLGNYIKAMSLCIRARDLLRLCGLSHGTLDYDIMTTQAEIHRYKSEYVEARSIHISIHEAASIQDPHRYGSALLSVAEIDVLIGAPKDVQRNCDRARKMLGSVSNVHGMTICDIILADLYLREGNSLAAKTILKRCYKLNLGFSEITIYCLERLGDASCWGDLDGMSSWTTIFLVNSLKRKAKLRVFKALQSFGDIFLAQHDEHTATSLFTVALEGFTEMDVHRSRAECMLRLGDISKEHSNLLKAVEFWERARPLFERSSQAQQVQHINERLAGISEDVLEQHRNNLAHLAELSAPSGTVEELEEDLSEIENLNEMDISEEKELNLIVA
ncbi:hypothetical protein B0H13DRAFT_2275378 [Mycena leptocephala]|nr:hypothetical protein B0H13DRAFT_2275378 [Mycena leptocephala]